MNFLIEDFDARATEALDTFSSAKDVEQISYENEYAIFLDFFSSNEGKWDASKVRLAGLAVYGWMPTILRAEGRGDSPRNVNFDRIACQLNDGRMQEEDYDFLNGSFVGTSKFLHFWRPDKFAIWDSRIYKALKMRGLVNSRKNFEAFQSDIKTFQESRRPDLSLREVEIALFLKGSA